MTRCAVCRRPIWPWQHYGFRTGQDAWHVSCPPWPTRPGRAPQHRDTYRRDELLELAGQLGVGYEYLEDYARRIAAEPGRMTHAQMDTLIAMLWRRRRPWWRRRLPWWTLSAVIVAGTLAGTILWWCWALLEVGTR